MKRVLFLAMIACLALSAPAMSQESTPRREPPAKPERPAKKIDGEKIKKLLDKLERARSTTSDSDQDKIARALKEKHLAQSEIDQFRIRLRKNWTPPVGTEAGAIVLNVTFDLDGNVAVRPVVVSAPDGATPAQIESAIKALYVSEPFDMLTKDNYSIWKEMQITFDPRDMFPK